MPAAVPPTAVKVGAFGSQTGWTTGPAGVVTADGLDRAELSARVFGDPNDLLRLNAVVHPSLGDAVARAAGEGTASGNRRVVIEAAVLFEIGADGLCDEVWFVDCPPEERIRRLRAGRGLR